MKQYDSIISEISVSLLDISHAIGVFEAYSNNDILHAKSSYALAYDARIKDHLALEGMCTV